MILQLGYNKAYIFKKIKFNIGELNNINSFKKNLKPTLHTDIRSLLYSTKLYKYN